jgi:hypothetical protein
MEDWGQLVESTITAIKVDSIARGIQIDVITHWEGDQRKRIIADGVNDLLIDDVRSTNIIDRVIMFGQEDLANVERDCLARLFYLLQKREPTVADLEWPTLNQKLALIRDGSLLLMEIEPVCGASFLVLAESVRLEAGE